MFLLGPTKNNFVSTQELLKKTQSAATYSFAFNKNSAGGTNDNDAQARYNHDTQNKIINKNTSSV